MKVKLKYSIFWSSPNDNRVYVFWKEDKTTKLDMLKEANGWKGDIIIDATGTKYIIKCSYMTKWKGIHGFTGGFTGMIYYEQEYEDNPESFSLRQLQDRIAERYPKTRWFKEEGWGSRNDFRRTVYGCKTFEELPENAKAYIRFIEEYIGIPVKFIGTGAEREAMIVR